MKLLLLGLCCLVSSLLSAQPAFMEHYPDSINKKRLRSVVGTEVGTYVAGLSFLSFIWYKDHDRVPFHYYNDAKGYLQMDKAGHAYSAYYESYNAYYSLRWAGLDKKRALLFGGPLGLIFQTPIEIFDGLYEGWGFSWPDMVANTAGSALFVIQEMAFDDQIAKLKFSYSPSTYRGYHPHLGETHLQSFFMDYNAHTYWLSLNLRSIIALEGIPNWLNLAIGYSANGMIKEFDNPSHYRGKPIPDFERYRQWVLSLDIDFTKFHSKHRWLNTLYRHINLLKIPFPAIEFNRIDGTRMRWLYF